MTTFADGSLADLASRHESVSSLMQSYDAACARAEAAESDYSAVIERERVELLEWSERLNDQFKLRQQAEASASDLAKSNREQAETIDTLRAELLDMRASFVTLKARCDELTEMAIGRDAEIERLYNAIEALTAQNAEQARRLYVAYRLIQNALDRDISGSIKNPYWQDGLRAWLSTNAHAPQAENKLTNGDIVDAIQRAYNATHQQEPE